MNDKDFQALWLAAFEYEDKEKYIADHDEIAAKAHRTQAMRHMRLSAIWNVAHMSIREMIDQAGLNQSSFSRRFCVPLRTVQNWCSESGSGRDCPPWAKLGFARQLDML